ncbi:hypothetical protein K402DRAFT_412678 [Aulographum hederae CBS 113979]|uniref:Protein prenylyltransferase n=1 Tax=Aulographum hederae CBS 113979 TaxID=1176131 RepID=A0A6G1H0D0_9PEZI|nr:hypothetical protein K402DRAFT_412678 [Aulographum hederae CBS 113979]
MPLDIEIARGAYAAISAQFDTHADRILEIEILPSAIKPPEGDIILVDGQYIGVPKKILAAAFLVATKIFWERSPQPSNDDASALPADQGALAATRIILLFDPEYVTAANYRKKQLLQRSHVSLLELAVKQELCFLDTVLNSRLHRQTKSPTLWFHRLWLLKTFRVPSAARYDPVMILSAPGVHGEFRTILTAGERHPNNYYAWQYGRQLIAALLAIPPVDLDFEVKTVLHGVTRLVLDWTTRHPGDTSGWSFLYHILLLPEQEDAGVREAIFKVANLAMNLGMSNESLWVFLRTIIRHEEPRHPRIYGSLVIDMNLFAATKNVKFRFDLSKPR